jgi:hemoglobin/transferrin/lactoferrin receptor protein
MTAFRPSAQPAAAFVHLPIPATRPRALNLGLALALSSLVGASLPAQAQQAADADTKAASATAALGEILVVAERDKALTQAGTATVIGGDELGQRNASDMSDIARYQPLISVPLGASGGGSVWDSTGNTGFNIRGMEGNRVSLDIDGIAVPDAAPKPDGATTNSFGIGRDYFDPETFREVRLDSGTSAAGAGTPGLGGSVAFVTKAPEDYLNETRSSYAEYKLGYDSANGSRSHVLTGAQRVGSVNLLAVAIHRDGEQTENNGSVAANPQDWKSDALLAKLNWTISPEQTLGFTIDAYRRDTDNSYDNKVSTSYPNGVEQESATRRNRFSVDHRYTPAANALFDTLNTRVYFQDAKVEDTTDARYVTGGQTYQRHIETSYNNKSMGLASDASKRLNPSNLLTYGVSYEHIESSRPWTEDRTVIATGAHQYTTKARMADTDTDKVSAYLSDEFTFDLAGHKAVLTPGLRGEYRRLDPTNTGSYAVAVSGAASELTTNSGGYLAPSLSLSVQLTPDLLGYVQYKHGARMPTATELTGTYDSFSYTGAGSGYAVLGNADLKKETSDAFEIGLKGTAAKGLTFSSSVFYTRYQNYIEEVSQALDPVNYPTLTLLYRPENIGKVAIWGAEASARAELGSWAAPLSGFSANLAAGVTHSRAENTDTGATGELASTLPFKATAGLAYDDAAKRFGLALNTVYTASKLAGADVITGSSTAHFEVPAATVFDLTGYWNIAKNTKLNVGVYNLTDKQYWDYASVRSLAAGTTASALAEIQREARPGRNYGMSLSVSY